jgi:hypothetical protein
MLFAWKSTERAGKAAFHSSPSLMQTFWYPHQTLSFVKYFAPQSFSMSSGISGSRYQFFTVWNKVFNSPVRTLTFHPSFWWRSMERPSATSMVECVQQVSVCRCTYQVKLVRHATSDRPCSWKHWLPLWVRSHGPKSCKSGLHWRIPPWTHLWSRGDSLGWCHRSLSFVNSWAWLQWVVARCFRWCKCVQVHVPSWQCRPYLLTPLLCPQLGIVLPRLYNRVFENSIV